MPFRKDEIVGLVKFFEETETALKVQADTLQRSLWRRYSDELVGVPEVDPWCDAFNGLSLCRKPQRWWRNVTRY